MAIPKHAFFFQLVVRKHAEVRIVADSAYAPADGEHVVLLGGAAANALARASAFFAPLAPVDGSGVRVGPCTAGPGFGLVALGPGPLASSSLE